MDLAKLDLQTLKFSIRLLFPCFYHVLSKNKSFFFFSVFIFITKRGVCKAPWAEKAIHPSSRCCSTAYRLQDNTPELHLLQKCVLLAEAAPVALMCVQVFVFLPSPVGGRIIGLLWQPSSL